MQGYWIEFSDGTKGYCQGQNTYDAVGIAEKITGKKAIAGDNKYKPELKTLPYPASPIIWQLDHPVYGKTPAFCHSPSRCCGYTTCPQNRSCTD